MRYRVLAALIFIHVHSAAYADKTDKYDGALLLQAMETLAYQQKACAAISAAANRSIEILEAENAALKAELDKLRNPAKDR